MSSDEPSGSQPKYTLRRTRERVTREFNRFQEGQRLGLHRVLSDGRLPSYPFTDLQELKELEKKPLRQFEKERDGEESVVTERCSSSPVKTIFQFEEEVSPITFEVSPRIEEPVFCLGDTVYRQVENMAQGNDNRVPVMDVRVPLYNITPFSGGSAERVDKFLSDYKVLADISNWSEAQLVKFLPAYLIGSAKDWLEGQYAELMEKPWQEVKAALEKAFPSIATDPFVELWARKKLPTESFQNYVYAVQAICRRIDRNMADSHIISHLVRGLNAEVVQYLIQRDPKTVENALESLRLYEQSVMQAALVANSGVTTQNISQAEQRTFPSHVRILTNAPVASPRKSKTVKQEVSYSKEREYAVEYRGDRNYERTAEQLPPRRSDRCYVCQGIGHFARVCPSKPKSQSREMERNRYRGNFNNSRPPREDFRRRNDRPPYNENVRERPQYGYERERNYNRTERDRVLNPPFVERERDRENDYQYRGRPNERNFEEKAKNEKGTYQGNVNRR